MRKAIIGELGSPRDSENVVQWVYSSRTNEELAERYDEWAATYDTDLDRDFEWRGPELAAEELSKHVPTDALILDAGAGTGLVGKFLAERGYANLVAMDMSLGMLEMARAKSVYTEYHQMVMGDALGFPTGRFDAVVSVGVMTVGHAPANSLDELVRVTRPGGKIVYSLRPDVYEDAGFSEKHAELTAQGLWRLVSVTEPTQVLPRGEPDVFHRVWVYEVLPPPSA
jgi:SAM-dependent methyltransferase